MTASDRLREIGKDIHWEGSSTYNRPLVGAIALAKAFDEILLVVEAAENSGKLAGSPLEAALTALDEALS